MSKKIALIDYGKCRPEDCEGGICKAVLACPYKLLKQEKPGEIPMPHPSLCKGCAKCVMACPTKAVQII